MTEEELRFVRLLRPTTILSNVVLGPGMRRLVLSDPSLSGLTDRPAAQWVKLFPREKGAEPGQNLVGRAYTIRRFDADTHSLTIDVALHGGGVVSTWLEHAKPGDCCDVAGPRGGFNAMPSDCPCLVLAGDETAIPAIASILETVSPQQAVHAFIEVADKEFELSLPRASGTQIHWLHRVAANAEGASPLREHLLAQCAFRPDAYVWAAGEASLMRDLRKSLLTSIQFDARQIHTVGYWKRGEMDHKDVSAG